MGVTIRHYPQTRLCNEYYEVIDYLKKHSAIGLNKNWHWARWEWLLGHASLDESTLPSIGLFLDSDKIVGLVTHDMRHPAYIMVNEDYAFLKPAMVDYAMEELSHGGISSLYVDEQDQELIAFVKEKGYALTTYDEYALALDCSKKLSYPLDTMFHFTDYLTDQNIDQYVAVIHKGFENEGEPATGLTEDDFPKKPHDNPRLKLFVVAPDGSYAAHCGTWYHPDTEICYVEPVVTIPRYRGCGLGKAVVYACINRCIDLGAKKAIVISNQPFYYRIGFEPYSKSRLWEKRVSPPI